MNKFNRLWRKAAQLMSQSFSLADPAFGAAMMRRLGMGTYSGKAVTEESAMTATAFWACVRIKAETLGMLPGAVYELDRATGNYTPIDHDLNTVLFESPNADMTAVEFWETIGTNLAQQGNMVGLRNARGDGSITSIYPVQTGRTMFGTDRDGNMVYDINDRGKWETYPAEKIWHVKTFSSGGRIGYSPLIAHRQALGISMAAEEFQARFFAAGASPSLVVSVPVWLNEDERAKARKNLEDLWGGLNNAHSARLLEGGMKPEGTTMPLQEAQFAELRGFSVEELCRAFRIPPHMVMDLRRSTNNNIEQQSLEFIQYSVMPDTRRIGSSATKWLFTPAERKKYFVRWDLEVLLQADSAIRGEFISKMVQNAVFSRNEARAFLGRNRIADPMMDARTIQLQMVPLDMLPAIAQRAATAPATPAGGSLGGKEIVVNIDNSKTVNEGGDTHVINEVKTPTINVEPAPVLVPRLQAPETSEGKDLAKAIDKLGELIVDMRKGQSEDTALRGKILQQVERMG